MHTPRLLMIAMACCLPAWGAAAAPTLSAATDFDLGGVSFTDGDLARYRIDLDLAFENMDESVFVSDEDIDAIFRLSDGHLLLSTAGAATLGSNLLSFADDDIVEYDPIADIATLIFNGSSVFGGNENIDAVSMAANGNLVFSTSTAADIGTDSFRDGDVIEYDMVAGTATLFFNEDLFGTNEDINAFDVLPDGKLLISTSTASSLAGLSFSASDVVRYDPVAMTATLFFDGSNMTATGLANIDAVTVPEPATFALVAVGLLGLAAHSRRLKQHARQANGAASGLAN